ncbi:MAG: hypothetical protein HRF49_05400 [bacterium]|jgi:hypothetical protein
MSPELLEKVGIIIAGFLTLMMFSFIFKDNPFFKFGEHLYLGVAIGYYVNIQFFNFMRPKLIERLYPPLGPPNPPDPVNPDIVTFPDPNFWVIIPALLGIFILMRLIPKFSWLSRWSFAFYIGGYAGINLPMVINGVILPQLVAATAAIAFKDAAGVPAIAGGINTLILMIGTFCVLVYFFFSIEHRGVVLSVSRVGIWVLMITFGAAFGYTVMARMSLLIGRTQFLLFDWLKAFGINLS